MAIHIKTPEEITSMRISGKILADVLTETCKLAKIGISTYELDQFAEKFITDRGGIPAFKGYHGFPNTLCTAVNEEIVHGIPGKNKILKEGDLLTIDCGVIYQDMYTDAARSIGMGEISSEKTRLLKVSKEALNQAIDLVKPGLRLNEIGKLIEKIVKSNGFHIITDLSGHGIGRKLHESPTVLNYFDGTPGPTLQAGMCIAIEPIFSVGTSKMKTLKDGWTLVTIDGSTAVQEENTVLITRDGCEILTD